MELDGCKVSSNNAFFGGGIHNDASASLYAFAQLGQRTSIDFNSALCGGAIYNEGFMNLNADISYNKATYGGAIYNYLWGEEPTPSLSNVTKIHNVQHTGSDVYTVYPH